MTRYARAKGSKSSNEKVPEKATPWSEMKSGMVKQHEVASESTKKCLSIIKSKIKVQSKPSQWVSLDDENEDSLNILKRHLQKRKEKKVESDGDSSVGKKRKLTADAEAPVAGMKKSKKMKKSNEGKSVMDGSASKGGGDSGVEQSEQKEYGGGGGVKLGAKKGKVQKKKKKKEEEVVETGASENANEAVSDVNSKESEGVKKKKKKKLKLKKTVKSEGETKPQNSEATAEGDSEKTLKKMKSFAAKRKPGKHPKKPRNFKGGGDDNLKSNKFIMDVNIGGETVTLMKFQGFHIKKEDVKRLKELKRKMTEEGIPKGQIESALRLERRRCEKALARMRKNVCFHCRKPGHLLSQCPDAAENVDTSTGVCYKCGSAEHTAFSCKVSRGKSFPFAECFICKEKGHIARECPDNPRGLYPKGGACKICGDVTHLKKDCPKRLTETAEKTITLGVRNDRDLEGLDDDDDGGGGPISPDGSPETKKKKTKKAVVF